MTKQSKKTRSRDNNPLAKSHFNKVVRRSKKVKQSLAPIWLVTWHTRGRTFMPIGSASMLAMSYHPAENKQGDVIELLCITAQVDPQAGCIHYANVRMAHNFALNPHEGARGRILDPRDEGTQCKKGDKPNGSWVRLALEADRAAVRAVDANWLLPAAPQLPKFWAAFPSMDAIDMEVTDAMIRDIAAHTQKPFDEVKAMSNSDQMMLARAHWPELWVAPGAEGNETGLWLIPAEYTTKLKNATRIFEDFRELVGVDCWNPARDIKAIQFGNPTRECAEHHGIDLAATLELIAKGAEPDEVTVHEVADPHHNCLTDGDAVPDMTPTVYHSPYDRAVDNMMKLRECVCENLGTYGKDFSVDQLNAIITSPDEPIVIEIENLTDDVGEEDVVRLMRQQLEATRPIFSEGTTDADLAAAAQNPAAPLHASNMCKIQVLRRDLRIEPEDAFRFTPTTLERPGVYANLWAGFGWSPRADKLEKYNAARKPKQRKRRKPQHAAAK